ncbi:epoxide hydrolase [Solwaraspora sp. WMMD406]|uniref:epoxide hydrolase family protein n=1 Tax=Solwaraspora sp. WMMD406 TaxID=3016095 RepID=UPI00241706B1|nr:epoxide hydrolase family protein [Solwaraspora sp. WMMD406]MDG4766932.1 epoxide hydrolase [Solwaraspora sp. WMMD406]
MKPFRIDVPQDDLVDLRRRLARVRWPLQVPDVGWERGVPASYLRELVDYWQHEFDWRAAESRINQIPQFTTEIDGTTLHFLHVRSAYPDATPLLLTHGWPSSFVEFIDVIGPLTDPVAYGGEQADAFHVVIPSLPGYGFSGPPPGPGWGVARIAAAWSELMRRLGYQRYVPQGTDFGAMITLALAALDADRVSGAHVNFLITPPPSDPQAMSILDPDDLRRLGRLSRFMADESGYMKVQATRPVTVSYGLADSPVGQLAWIIEKFKEWTDTDKLPEDAIARDWLLTNASIYWFTATAGTAAQLYFETADLLPLAASPPAPPPVAVPLGVAVFPADPARPIRSWAEQMFPTIAQWTEHDRGGHFPAVEEPDLVVADLRRFRHVLTG